MIIKFLVVTDIHYSIANLVQLKQRLLNSEQLLDFIVCCGDIANIDNNSNPPSGPTCEQVGMEQAKQVLDVLAEIASCTCSSSRLKLPGDKRVLFVPGNHDPREFFSSPTLTGVVNNIHMSYLEITENLAMFGCGGSTDALLDCVPKYLAFPPTTELLLDETMDKLEEYRKTKDNGMQFILLTHTGASLCGSTWDRYGRDGKIDFGSLALRKRLKTGGDGILLNLHGHAHNCIGLYEEGRGGLKVLNPGDLQRGHYAIVTLQREEKSAEWLVSQVDLKTLL